MIAKALPPALALALAVVFPALAQAPATTPPAESAGPPSRSELKAARAEVRQACTDDYLKFCPGMDRKDARICMVENQSKLSTPCKDAIAKAPRRTKAAN
jgi:hypothetical protein